MSIDHFIWVPDGARNDNSIAFHKFHSLAEMRADNRIADSANQVFLAHGCVLIDQQYFFASADDARWFWLEGYKERLYVDSEGVPMSYDRMCLWINGQQVDERIAFTHPETSVEMEAEVKRAETDDSVVNNSAPGLLTDMNDL